MRQLLTNMWVKAGLAIMALPASMAHAYDSDSMAGDALANYGLNASLEASTHPEFTNPVGAGGVATSLRAVGWPPF